MALSIALPLFTMLAWGQEDERETWNKERILTAAMGLSLGFEIGCDATPVASSAWAGTQEQVAELHGGRLSPYDGVVFPNFHYVQIEHIVARKEADVSGLCGRGEAERRAFAGDLLNLTLAPGSLNASKSDGDIHEIMSAETSVFRDSLTPDAKCWFAAQSIRVKDKYALTVDLEERNTLLEVLGECEEEQVHRPRLGDGSDWRFRSELLSALTLASDVQIGQCATPVTDPTRLQSAADIVSTHLTEVACRSYLLPSERPVVETLPSDGADGGQTHPPTNPRSAQIEAQKACIQALDEQNLSRTCGNVSRACTTVEPILEGEPLYQFLRDADGNGIVCQSL